MQSNSSAFRSSVGNPFVFDGNLSEGFESPSVFFFLSFLFLQGGGMDLSKVGEKILSSVRSARSLGLLPSTSDRPEVPVRAAAAAAVARVLAGLPPHQILTLPSSSEELVSIYGSRPHGQIVEELEEDFYEEDFDPVRHVLEHIPPEGDDVAYFEKKATLRLAQLDRIAERLSRHVMEHHEEMVKGMHLVGELEQDLKVANVICMNGRRHLTSSMHEVSRDLVVTSHAKRKQALLDMLPLLTELRHALHMQVVLEAHVEEGNYSKAFQVLSEYLQLLESFSELSAVQDMSRGVEAWLSRTLQKLDSLLLGVCQEFKEESYTNVVDAYALIGDVTGLAEKIQSFFMQEVLSETHCVLKNIVEEDQESHNIQSSRITYSDLCLQIPESRFRECLLRTLGILFKLMCSYYAIMNFQPQKDSECKNLSITQKQSDISRHSEEVQKVHSVKKDDSEEGNGCLSEPINRMPVSTSEKDSTTITTSGTTGAAFLDGHLPVNELRNDESVASSSESPWDQLRRDATTFVSQTLQRGRKNLWQLTTSRVSVLLSSSAVCTTSMHQFLRNYEDLNTFILAGEAFCGIEAVEFRHKLKIVCENYFAAFHRQNIHALKMVLEKENWMKMMSDTVQVISFAGLIGDGAPLIVPSYATKIKLIHSKGSAQPVESATQKNGFAHWLNSGNLFLLKLTYGSREHQNSSLKLPRETFFGAIDEKFNEIFQNDNFSRGDSDMNHVNGNNSISEDENEDLHADFIDEDSQLPSRISKPNFPKIQSSHLNDEDVTAQTGSSLSLLRLMDKYARLMQKLEIVNVEFFKGICQLFEVFYHFIFESFGQQDTYPTGKGLTDSLNFRLKTALSRITQDCDQWIKPQTVPFSSLSPTALNASLSHTDVTPTSPRGTAFGHISSTSFGLKERCAGAETASLVARILHKSRAHLQSMLLQNNAAIVDDFYVNLVDTVPDLTEHIHRTTARLLLHVNGYIDRIANSKWELKDLGLEHNGYVDLLLGEFKHYKTRLAHGGIQEEVQNLLLEYGLEIVAETLIEGLSRVKRCTDEGRALMSLDLQVLINGLRHFVSINVRPEFQIVETFIKAYYLPETEYVHWARSHPEYSKNQIIGLVNLVATMKGWKRKTRLEVIEKIESCNV